MRKSASTSSTSHRTSAMVYGIHAFLTREMPKTIYGNMLMPRYASYLVRQCLSTILLNAISLNTSDRTIYACREMGDSRFKSLVQEAGVWLSREIPKDCLAWIQEGCIPDKEIEDMKLQRAKCDAYE